MKYCSLAIAVTLALNDIASGHDVQEGKKPPPDMYGNEVGDHHQTPHHDGSTKTLVRKGFRESHKGLTPVVMSSSTSLPTTVKFPANGTNSVFHWNGIFDDRNHGDSTSKNDVVAHGKAEQDGSEGPVHDRTSVKRSLTNDLDELSSWDGWKNIKPSNSRLTCVAGGSDLLTIRLCSEFSNSNDDQISWMHDKKGRIVQKEFDNCLTTDMAIMGNHELSLDDCSDTDEAQVWTRTANGQFKNKLYNTQVLARADCDADLVNDFTYVTIKDESDVPAGCDPFTVVGPHDHDPLDFGSVFFHQVGDDLAPIIDDESFGSSVSIDNMGDFIVAGGSTSLDDDNFVGKLSVYKRSGNTWIEETSFELEDHKSSVKPKVEVTISGDAKRVALAVASSNDNGAIQVLDFNKDSKTLTTSGFVIEGQSSGELHGLKLSMDRNGNTLVIGSPYYNNGALEDVGRVRIFDIETGELKNSFEGDNANDRAGRSVSISSDGDLIAYGRTGHDNGDNSDSGSARLLKLEDGIWVPFGDLITGEETKDETGFSVKVVHFQENIILALGAIFNDGNKQVNSGHVQVYQCDYTDCNGWTKVGSDIDGDNGVVLNGDAFHVGDAFGFSLDMSEDGTRLIIGAPFHSASRASDYYSGSAKLFGFNSAAGDNGDWEQLGHDLVGDTTTETSGYSVGMSRNGKTLLIGSPGTNRGTVQVYLQDEVSNMPSTAPSTSPSSAPSSEPSSAPSSMPSKTPSEEPTTTNVPSTAPSSAPSNRYNRPFQIRSTYKRFDKVVGSGQTWCIQAASSNAPAKLNMRPCDGSSLQTWIFDDNGMVVLEDYPNFAIDFEARVIRLGSKGSAKSKNYKFVIDTNSGTDRQNSISVEKESGKTFFIGIDPSKLFSRLRLYKNGEDNESLFQWHIDYHGPSSSPSVRLLHLYVFKTLIFVID